MSLREQLQAVYNEHGTLTPSLVVDTARPEDHPLHNRFEWDDAVAGEAWRREQAHQLIRSVRVVVRPATEDAPQLEVRAFHAVRSEAGHVYEPTEKIATNPFLTELLMRDMEREWKQLRDRYSHFQEFIAMVQRDLSENLVAA